MPILLTDELPDFSIELQELLAVAGEPELAAQIRQAEIVQLCSCHDDFCASFYTKLTPRGPYPPGFRTLTLEPEQGMINVDVVDDKIVCVEVLYRDEVKKALEALRLEKRR